MRVVFCGVGEAFDENLTNTSILIQEKNDGSGRSILLDCGFTAAPSFWRMARKPLELDAVWISHLHGDHFLGLPQLFIRYSEHGRTKPLNICGGSGTEDAVSRAVELAYPGKWSRLGFRIEFIEVDPGEEFDLAWLKSRAALVDHPVSSQGIKLESESGSLFYSGDGRVELKARNFLVGCDLGIFEAFCLERDVTGHSNAAQVAEISGLAGIKRVALVHMHREERLRYGETAVSFLQKQGIDAILPAPGDSLII